jgi:hypothetical protein
VILKPEDFATYVHSYFAKSDDPEDFFSVTDEKGLTRYAITRAGAATDNELARYGTRLFEFYVRDFNKIYGLEHNAAFLKARTEQVKIQNRRATR